MADNNTLALKITADVASAMAGLEQLNKQVSSVGKTAVQSAEQINQGYTSAAKGVRSISEQLSGLQDIMAKGAVALGAVASIKGIGSALIEAQQSAEKLKNTLEYSVGASKVASEMEYLRTITRNMGVDFATASQSYGKFTAAVKGTGISIGQTKTIFEGVAGAAAKMGLSADETQGAFLALSQMASKGTVSAEELRGQLAERLPGALRIAAQAMGVTDKEFNKLLETGQIMASDFLPKFGQALKDNFQAPVNSLTQEINRLNSAWDQWKQSLADADGGGFKFITNGLDESAAAMRALGKEAGIVQKLLVAIGGFQAGAVGLGKFDTAKIQQDALADLEQVVKGRRALESKNLNYLEQESLRDLVRQEKVLRDQLLELAVQKGKGVDIKPNLEGEFAAQTAKRKTAFDGYMKEVQSEKDKQISAENARFSALTAVIGAGGKQYEAALAEHNRTIAEINKKGTKSAGASGLKNDAAQIFAAEAKMAQDAAKTQVEIIQEKVKQQVLSEREGIDQILAAQNDGFVKQAGILKAQLAGTKDSGERAKLKQEIESLGNAATLAAEKAASGIVKIDDASLKAQQNYLKGIGDETASLISKADAAEFELSQIGMTAEQFAVLTAKRYDEKIAIEETEAARLRDVPGSEAELFLIEQKIDALNRLKSVEITKPKLTEQAREWRKFSDDIERSLTDALMRSFESGESFGDSFIKNLKNTFKTAALKLVIQTVTNGAGNLVGTLGNAAINGVLGTSGSNGGAGTNYLGLANNASSAYSLYGAATGYNSTVNTAASLVGAGSATGASAASLAYANGVGALGGDSLGALIAANGSWGGVAVGTEAAATTGWASMLGEAATGAWVLAIPAIAGAISAAGSRKAYEFDGVAIKGDYAGSNFTGSAATKWEADGGWWESGDKMKKWMPLTDNKDAIIEAFFGGGLSRNGMTGYVTPVSGEYSKAIDMANLGDLRDTPAIAGVDNSKAAAEWDAQYAAWQKANPRVWSGIGWAGSGEDWAGGERPEEVSGYMPSFMGAGFFGSVTKTPVLSTDPVMLAALDNAIDAIFKATQTSFKALANQFEDTDLAGKVDAFSTSINLDTKSGDIDKVLAALASDVNAKMAQAFLPSIETLRLPEEAWQAAFNRVMVEVAGTSRILDMMGTSIKKAFGSDTNKAITAIDGLSKAFGGIDNLSTSFSAYYANFYSAEEQRAQAMEDMGKAFTSLNLAMPTTRAEFRALADAAMIAGNPTTFKALMDLQGGFANLVPALESTSAAINQAAIDLASLRKSLADKYAAPLTLADSKQQITDAGGAELLNFAASADVYARLSSFIVTADKAALDALVKLEPAIAAWAESLDTAAETARASAEAAAEAVRANALASLDAQRAGISAYSSAGVEAMQKAVDLEKQRITVIRSVATESAASIKGVFGLLKDQVSSLYDSVASTQATGAAQGQAFIANALSAAQSTGYLPDQEALSGAISSARGGLSVDNFATQFEADKAALVMAGQLSQLQNIAGQQLPAAEQAVKIADEQLKALDDSLLYYRKQLDALNGIKDTTLDLTGSVDEIGAALISQITAMSAALNASIVSNLKSGAITSQDAVSQLGTSGVATDTASTAGGSAVFTSQFGASMVDGVVRANNGFSGTITEAKDAITTAFNTLAPKDFRAKAIEVGVSAAMIDYLYSFPAGHSNKWAAENGLASFAVGTNYVPRDMVANIHEGEAIIPKAYNPAAGGGANARLEKLVEGLTAEVQRLQSIVDAGNKHASRTANAVNGNPEQPMLVETV